MQRAALLLAAAGLFHGHLGAQSAKPRVLFLTHTAGFQHEVVKRPEDGSLSCAEKQLAEVLAGEFEVECTKDCTKINAAELATCSLVVFHTTGELPIPGNGRQELLDFVKAGGGFLGLHCAADTFYQYAPYLEMVGAVFDGHPWHQNVRVIPTSEAPVAWLAGKSFEIHDEIYQFRAAPPADARVCLALDMQSVDATLGKLQQNALAWWRALGTGRVFYTALGHGEPAWSNASYQRLLLEAARFVARPAAGSLDLEAARAAFVQVQELSDADGGRLWGRAMAGPLLFVDPDTRQVCANRPDAQGRLRPRDDVWTGTLEPGQMLANSAVDWSGTHWSMVLWPLPEDAAKRAALLMHESFHRAQADLGFPMADPKNPHLDARDGRLWLRLEWRALMQALLGEGAAREQAAGDALLFRARRRLLYPGSMDSENALELNEGLAEYTGIALAHATPTEREQAALGALRWREKSQSFVRGFAYASGPAYGLLLDATRPDWRRQVGRTSSMGKLLYEALGLHFLDLHGQEPVELVAARRLALYGGAELAVAEDEREALRKQREIVDRARYVDGPLLRLPMTDVGHYSFDPNGVHPLGGIGTVYASALVLSDAWGVLTAPGGAMRSAQGDWLVPAPPAGDGAGPNLTGEGWTLVLTAGWKLEPGARPGDRVMTAR